MYKIKKPDVVFFDWDGTIVQITDVIKCFSKSLLAEFPLPFYTEDEFEKEVETAFGMGVIARDAVTYLYKNTNYDIEKILDFIKSGQMQHMPLLATIEGVVDVIRLIYEKGIPMCIVSNRDATSLNREVKKLQLDQYFKCVASYEDSNNTPKPMPDIIHYCMDILNNPDISISNCWIVGDQMTDIGCAINSGAMPVFVGVKEDLTAEFIEKIDKNEVVTINKYHQLADIINDIC